MCLKEYESKILEMFETCTQQRIGMEDNLQLQNIDSIHFVQFIVAMEEEFDCQLEDKYLNVRAFQNLREVVNLISANKV